MDNIFGYIINDFIMIYIAIKLVPVSQLDLVDHKVDLH